MTSAQPWYMYPMDSPGGGYGEGLDPVCVGGGCDYLKPDTNISIPSGTPITTLLPGIVTNVTDFGHSGGGLSVTEKLDTPLNSLATHISYNYLGNATVTPGQRLAQGQQLGTAGSPTGINFALALTNDASWGGPSFHYNATGNPLLDPRMLLNAARSGKLGDISLLGSSLSGTTVVTTGSGVPIIGPLIDWLNTNISQPLQTVIPWISNPLRVIKLLTGLALVGLSIWLLVSPEAEKVATSTVKTAVETGAL